MGSRDTAEAAFKSATTKPPEEPAPKAPSIPGPTELVSLRIPRDVLDHFQEDGPGWQDRIIAALRKAAGVGGASSRPWARENGSAAVQARPDVLFGERLRVRR